MSHTVVAAGVFDYFGLVIFAAIFIGSMILRARAEAKARERRMRAAEGEGEPETPPPEVRAIMRRIGREPGPRGIPVARPVEPAAPPAPRRPAARPRRAGVTVLKRRPPVRPTVEPSVSLAAEEVIIERAAPTPAAVPEPEPAEPGTSLAQLRGALERDLAGGPAGLRKAILLSEILGPPRALRPLEDRLAGPTGA